MSTTGWMDGCACAEGLAVGLGRPVQGGAGTSVSLHVIARALPQPGKNHSGLGTSLSPPSFCSQLPSTPPIADGN